MLVYRISFLDGETRPIVILGQNDQYLGFEVRSDNTYRLIYNKTGRLPVPGLTADVATHELTIIHNSVTDSTQFYLGNTLIGELDVPLDREEGDGRITNVNDAMAQSFLGYWSNLFIYGSEDITALRDRILENAIRLSPNPTSGYLHISADDNRIKKWNVCNASGRLVLNGNYQHNMQIDIHQIVTGTDFLQLMDASGRIMVSRSFVRI